MTTRTIKHIDPLGAAKISAIIYGIMGCIFIPFMWLGVFTEGAGLGMIWMLMMPVLYAIGGLLSGLIGAALYNLASGWVGGLAIEFVE